MTDAERIAALIKEYGFTPEQAAAYIERMKKLDAKIAAKRQAD